MTTQKSCCATYNLSTSNAFSLKSMLEIDLVRNTNINIYKITNNKLASCGYHLDVDYFPITA